MTYNPGTLACLVAILIGIITLLYKHGLFAIRTAIALVESLHTNQGFFKTRIMMAVVVSAFSSILFSTFAINPSTIHNGPTSVLSGGFVSAVIIAIFSSGMVFDGLGKIGAAIIGVWSLICSLILPISIVVTRDFGIQTKAPEIKNFGLAHFDAIDLNHDGIINSNELKQAANSQYLTDQDHKVLSDLDCRQTEIGHIVGSHKEPMLLGGPPAPPITIPVKVNDYGISREDLQTYPQRIEEMYKNW